MTSSRFAWRDSDALEDEAGSIAGLELDGVNGMLCADEIEEGAADDATDEADVVLDAELSGSIDGGMAMPDGDREEDDAARRETGTAGAEDAATDEEDELRATGVRNRLLALEDCAVWLALAEERMSNTAVFTSSLPRSCSLV